MSNPFEEIQKQMINYAECLKTAIELKNLIQKKQEPMKDLTKILKDGDEVYYTVTGQMHQIGIKKGFHNVILLDGENFLLSCFGSRFDDGECLIFPSKEERNWDNFKRKEEFKRGDLCAFWDGGEGEKCIGIFYSDGKNCHGTRIYFSAILSDGNLSKFSPWDNCEKINIEDYI